MITYQLSCGHWVRDWAGLEAGSHLPCKRCDTLRTTIIGWAASAP